MGNSAAKEQQIKEQERKDRLEIERKAAVRPAVDAGAAKERVNAAGKAGPSTSW